MASSRLDALMRLVWASEEERGDGGSEGEGEGGSGRGGTMVKVFPESLEMLQRNGICTGTCEDTSGSLTRCLRLVAR